MSELLLATDTQSNSNNPTGNAVCESITDGIIVKGALTFALDTQNINIDHLERIQDGKYLRYYAVNRQGHCLRPYGIGNKPLTKDQAQKLYARLQTGNPNDAYQIEVYSVHIGYFAGYEHLLLGCPLDNPIATVQQLANSKRNRQRNQQRKRRRYYKKRQPRYRR